MNDVIDNPADCEVRSVIRFLNARHLKPAEIYRQLKEVYGDTVMNEINVKKWCEMFNNGQTNVHDETRPGRPSLITEDLKTKVNDRILQDRRTSLDELHIAFPDISRSLLGEIVSQHLGYHKICARPHTTVSTRELLDQFGWEISDHPPYSPDLAPSDFHLFTKLKDFLGGTRFGSDEELKKTVNTWLNELAAEEHNTGILKLVNRYDKCLNRAQNSSVKRSIIEHLTLCIQAGMSINAHRIKRALKNSGEPERFTAERKETDERGGICRLVELYSDLPEKYKYVTRMDVSSTGNYLHISRSARKQNKHTLFGHKTNHTLEDGYPATIAIQPSRSFVRISLQRDVIDITGSHNLSFDSFTVLFAFNVFQN
ncbi:hypothetical protein ANN_27281 [Periplaneta americana]|uniref:Mos1 transposase HTH domain-containing protein n=1 Tax=Periplaneta americana TaxID=6978 RepID=A0ABQ8RXW3_PERAM|nr:hypothetical protein ANN_27281 [Periplaneta americana]